MRTQACDAAGVVSDTVEPPFDRWGRVESPPEMAGLFILVEVESGDRWKKPPPADAVRVWHRRPGVNDDHDDNSTVWLHRHQLPSWLSSVTIKEWLPEGVEPDWEKL